ncbi:MAG: Cytochrome c oxidase assembly protein cox19 [Claussenomyces sp. TS43310]|nr:MAG: Cytochrome c oxidase assembly protein cox19 [Claussenomyces sp. TS43310]
MSSFGSPGGKSVVSKPIPPERGSFPLDHDGECKAVMMGYLACIKKVRGMNDPECRNLAKSYLSCRMDRYEIALLRDLELVRLTDPHHSNLMAKDEFKNLGFPDETPPAEQKNDSGGKTKDQILW